jgi:hypothetical protein
MGLCGEGCVREDGGEGSLTSVKRCGQICGLMLALSCAGNAQEHPCPTLMPTIHTWDVLYKSFRLYGHWDDGAVGEGYSESVARILVDHWNTLTRLSSLGAENVGFRRFVLKHVDASLDMKDVEKIRTKARTQCPQGLRSLCDDLRKQADLALKEDAAPR